MRLQLLTCAPFCRFIQIKEKGEGNQRRLKSCVPGWDSEWLKTRSNPVQFNDEWCIHVKSHRTQPWSKGTYRMFNLRYWISDAGKTNLFSSGKWLIYYSSTTNLKTTLRPCTNQHLQLNQSNFQWLHTHTHPMVLGTWQQTCTYGHLQHPLVRWPCLIFFSIFFAFWHLLFSGF